EACGIREQISVVKDGVTAFGTGYITAMHDPTEGGLSGGLHELCDASDVGFRIDLDRIPVHDATRQVCDRLSIDFMELISSGCMLMTCYPDHSEDVVSALEAEGILATVIGTIESEPQERMYKHSGEFKPLRRPSTDALWDALKQLNQT
ncbi:MAG: AIR synthase-related protein, partial [Candidatus Sifarchaeia archaeon]